MTVCGKHSYPLNWPSGWNMPWGQAAQLLSVVVVPLTAKYAASHVLTVHASQVAGVQSHSLCSHQSCVTLVIHIEELFDVVFLKTPSPHPSPFTCCVVISVPLSHVTVTDVPSLKQQHDPVRGADRYCPASHATHSLS
jgi:hypothetical protein